ncbi:M2 family metallopeptidase [Longimicrobium sp.]|uniref:M2 family metallopeptidase n=1 Tax=Longimicrobium sp. TaxID=2029185 RepID=UPI002C867F7D|nr:M2 family metallopeptidase [Longimicrobium sp.]HSU16746.1 M2 family metallopeptidase [Longimicrobium sp.]
MTETESTAALAPSADGEARAFVAELEARVAPLMRESHLASWDAAVGAGDDALERATRARAAVAMVFADAGDARKVREWLAARVGDALLRRQLVLLDHEFTRNQLPRETIEDLVRRGAELEHVFHTFRSTLRGRRLSNNELLEALQEAEDPGVRREAWEAAKEIGREVAGPLLELVRRRNAAARSQGFPNYYAMELHLQELGEERLFAVLDEFRDRTDEPFRRFRADMDGHLARRFGVRPDELRPWHWDDFFAQEAPAITGSVDLDAYFGALDPVALAREFFRGIGLPVDEVLANSDLYEREGKDQHAFCIDLDREGDVRVLCNMRPNEKWTSTILHELGHAAYDRYVPRELPFFLRTISHTLSTEAIAMYMGRLTRDPAWLREVPAARLAPGEAKDVEAQQRAAMLVSARWMLVMAYFERELYRDPDRPDLNAVWWELVERLQLIRRPDGRDAPDWASKIHLSLSPVYYHNYLLGELMASQISARARRGVPAGRSIAGHAEVGAFLREKIFAPGASLDWNELLVHATGEPLSPRYFVEEFVGG